MTDERQGEALWPAIERLPRGSGIIFRHYGLAEAERRSMARDVRRLARKRGLVFIAAGNPQFARAVGADGLHARKAVATPRDMIRTAPAHDAAELVDARRIGADLVFLSPAFQTDSHPGEGALGPLRFARLSNDAHAPVIALGGMDAARARSLSRFGIHGWAGIGALTPKD